MPGEMPFSFAQFLNMRAAGGATFDPSGERVAFVTDITGVPQVWAIASGGGWPDQLTFASERVNFARYAPVGGHLVFGMDSGGNEQQQLYLLSPDASRVTDLTQRPDAFHYWGDWSADGQTLAFASNRRHPQFFDVYTHHLPTGETRCVYQADAYTMAGAFSPDGTRLVLLRVNGSLDDDLLLLDLVSGATTHLTPHEGKAVYRGVAWAADGQGLYLAMDQDRDTATLAYLNLADGGLTILDDTPWDVEAVALSPDGRTLAYVVNEDGYSDLRFLDTATREPLPDVTGLPQGVIGVLPICRDPGADQPLAWSPDGRTLAVSFSSGTNLPDVWLVVSGDEARRLTHSGAAGIPREALVEPTLVRYPSFDELEVKGFYYVPPHAEGKLAVVAQVHGGPEGQSRPAFNAVVAYFVNRGYAVLLPNVRGSTGYGRRYTHLDDVERRMDSVADLEASVRWLVAEGNADPQRIAVMGGSYGGFMTLLMVPPTIVDSSNTYVTSATGIRFSPSSTVRTTMSLIRRRAISFFSANVTYSKPSPNRCNSLIISSPCTAAFSSLSRAS